MSENNKYIYDAFISYRQLEPDKKIARLLHRALETYRVPRSLVRQGKKHKIKRIFRDIEELAATSDLSLKIRNTLKQSRYLIVICSLKTSESKWIAEEIRIFKELRRYDRILTLTIEGEIHDVIPLSILEQAEPLSADIRDPATRMPSIRLLKDAKLRLLAPILDCDYDDLKQREQKRQIRNLTTAAAVMLALVCIFAVLSVQLFIKQNALAKSRQELSQANVSLKNTNQRLTQTIFETSAIYTQFFLTVNDDYEKWARASGKLIRIINEKNVSKAIKANNILARYITLKGYKPGDDIEVYPFYESPEYFLKTMCFRNAKFTTGIIEDRFESLFILDNLSFPALFFEFVANTPIELPRMYQRFETASKHDLIRYGKLFEAISFEEQGKHEKAMDAFHIAVETGLFHSFVSTTPVFGLDSVYMGMYYLDHGEDKLEKGKQRLMVQKEKMNLVRHLNTYYQLTFEYSMDNRNRLVALSGYEHPDDMTETGRGLLDHSLKVDDTFGRIHYNELKTHIMDAIGRKLPDNDSLNELLAMISKEPGLPSELEVRRLEFMAELDDLRTEYKKDMAKIRSETISSINALFEKAGLPEKDWLNTDSEPNNDITKDTGKKRNTEAGSNQTGSDNVVENKTQDLFSNNKDLMDKLFNELGKDTTLFDEHISDLPELDRNRLIILLNIPGHVEKTGKEIRIFLAQQIRPYRVHEVNYDSFLTNPTVFGLLKEILRNEPGNPQVLFALGRYHFLNNDRDKAISYYKKAVQVSPDMKIYGLYLADMSNQVID